MSKLNAMVFDLEIKKGIADKRFPAQEGVAYCEGWHDHKNMGISVLCAYDYVEERYRVFCDDNQNEFRELVNARDIVVGFNSVNFDSQVVKASWVYEIAGAKHYDLLQEIWNAHGLGPDFNFKTHGGFGLDACVRANFGLGKTGDGASAPVMWQRGRIGAVIDYCLEDVRLTKLLFELIITEGKIECPKTGRFLALRQPEHKPVRA